MLASLATEDKGDFTLAALVAAGQEAGALRVAQRGHRCCAFGDDDGTAVSEGLPPELQRPCHVGERLLGVGLQMRRQPRGGRIQGRLAARGPHEQLRTVPVR